LLLLETEVAGFSETSVETLRLQAVTSQNTNLRMRFEVYTPVVMKTTGFGKVMRCSYYRLIDVSEEHC
jgi:hypothetical protein